jgi:hypothetical protein
MVGINMPSSVNPEGSFACATYLARRKPFGGMKESTIMEWICAGFNPAISF